MQRSPWTPEDRALMLAWQMYQSELCPKCGHPKETAWHPHMEGWFEVTDRYTCHVCTAMERDGAADPAAVNPVEFFTVTDTRPDPEPLMPLAEVMDLRRGATPAPPGEEQSL